tara:strand:- start:3260 stop:3901 length:642 start_codon:yes stop_codon:yes gene_type:complete
MKKILSLALVCVLGWSLTLSAFEDRLGEETNFVLIKDKARTNYMVQSGKSKFQIMELKEVDGQSEYLVHWKYDVMVKWAGRRAGTIRLMMPNEVFDDYFWASLENSAIKTSNLKMTFLGKKDSVSLNNQTFKDCNVIKINEVKNSNLRVLEKMLILKALDMGVISEHSLREETVENIEIEAVTHQDAKGLGILQWTIQGDVRGYSIKMGFDLI